MKKIFTLSAIFAVLTLTVNAANYKVNVVSGSAYSPALLTVHIGDTVIITGSAVHPLVQVSKTTWTSNGTTALTGGWGSSTKNVTVVVNTADTIYYVCSAHVEFGMKGRIVVGQFSGIDQPNAKSLSVSVYPNPVSSTATVKLSTAGTNPVTVMLFNITGQLEKDLSSSLTSINGDYYAQFDASQMSGGIHFIQVSDGTKKVVGRFEVIR